MKRPQPIRNRIVLAAVFSFLFCIVGASSAFALDENAWTTNGIVKAVAVSDGVTYVGGSFSQVGAYTGSAVSVDATLGRLSLSFPKFDGTVDAVIPDGHGGWYVGGSFSQADHSPRNNVAHVLSSGILDSNWHPSVEGRVWALALNANGLYVGGDFTGFSPANQPARNLAAFDATTGQRLSWYPDTDGPVRAITVAGGVAFIGGSFTAADSQLRNHIAAIALADGQLTSWNPNANKDVLELVAIGNRIYAGGDFGTIDGTIVNQIAAIDATSGHAVSWFPNKNSISECHVYALGVLNNTVYIGGYFTEMGGSQRKYLAAVDATTALATSWNPNLSNSVFSLTINQNTLYVGGLFTRVEGFTRQSAAAYDLSSGQVTSWDPNAGAQVMALAAAGGVVYMGGTFGIVGGTTRNGIAALDSTTGVLKPWNPNCAGDVHAITVDGTTVYVGGLFGSIGGQARANLAGVNAGTGLATAWNPSFDISRTVYAIALSPTRIYVGGDPGPIGGSQRDALAAFDRSNGQLTAWQPFFSQSVSVRTLGIKDTTVLVGGRFTSVGGQTRNNIAAIESAVTAQPTPWNPNANGEVDALRVVGDTVYAGGLFTTIDGQTRNSLAALDAATGHARAWNPDVRGEVGTTEGVYALGYNFTTMFIGGNFRSVGGAGRIHLAEVDLNTGAPTSWNPIGIFFGGQGTKALEVQAGRLYAGGEFFTVDGEARTGFAQFPVTSLPVPTLASVSPNTGTAGGDTMITVTGSNFFTTPTITIGSSLATQVSWVNSTTLTARTPKGNPGPADVFVTNPDGQKSNTLKGGFTYLGTVVVITTPTDNSVFPAGGDITIVATASSPNGTITRVEFAATNSDTSQGIILGTVLNAPYTVQWAKAPAGPYSLTATATDSTGVATISKPVFILVNNPPTITAVAPANGSTSGGTSIQLSGTHLFGVPTVSIGGRLATQVVLSKDNLTISALTPSGTEGSKDVVVINPDGLTSNVLVKGFTYIAPPVISQQPTDQSVVKGQSATFSLTASGTAPLTFRWQRSNNGGTTWTDISGAGAASYTLNSTSSGDNGAGFHCIVSNSVGNVTSDKVSLTVTDAPVPPALTQQPSDQSVIVGQSAGFTVKASGTAPLSFRWQRSNDHGVSWTDIQEGVTYTLASAALSDSGAMFHCSVTNSLGTAVSNAATLTVTSNLLAPTVSAVTPNLGPTSGGTSIAVSGANFLDGARVKIGNVECSNVVFVDSTKLTAVTPPETAGSKVVQVVNSDGQSATASDTFLFVSPVSDSPDPVNVVKAYPNPHHKGDGVMNFQVPSASEIKIFDTAGNLVRELHGSGVVQWDLHTEGGTKIVPGLYVGLVKASDGSIKRIPFAVIE